MVAYFHLNASDKSETIAAYIKTGAIGFPVEFSPLSNGILVASENFKHVIPARKKRKTDLGSLVGNVCMEKINLILHFGVKHPILNKNIQIDKAIIIILGLIENTFGFSLGIKDVLILFDAEPGFSIDISIKARVDVRGIILSNIKKISRR